MTQPHSEKPEYSPRRVRLWAWRHGINVPKTGVLPAEVLALYLEVVKGVEANTKRDEG